jgi:predicted DNA-binding transcriptional regulator YafY
LSMAFPEPLASHVAFTAEAVRHYPVDNNFVEILEVVSRAWAERRKVRVWYSAHSSGETKVRDFAPYFIEPTPQGGLYTIGRDGLSGEIRTLKFQRMQKVQLTDEPYTIPTEFDANNYFSGAWGIMGGDGHGEIKVSLVFSAESAPLIREHIWHESQKIEPMNDGCCRLTLWVNDWREMRPWIRSWGSQVEVEEPDSLREDILLEATRIAERSREVQQRQA